MASRFEIKHTTNGQFMFNLKAANGAVILTSESYKAKTGALTGIESVRTNAKIEERFEHLENSSGAPYFVLKAKNGKIVGVSEAYSTTTALETGIASVQKNAPGAPIDDLT